MVRRLPFRVPLPNLGPRTRKVLRIAGYVVLALVSFVFALQATFPYHRVKTKIEESLAEKYQVSILDVERGWIPGRMYFKSVTLKTRPTKTDETETTIFIDRLMVDLDFLPLLRGAASVNLDAKIGAGTISGNVTISKGGTSVAIEAEGVQSQMLPMRDAIGLPMSGMVELAFDLDLPNEKQKSGKTAPNWQKAEGSARIACPSGCTFGDGKTKLKAKMIKDPRRAALAADGIEFGTIILKSLLAKVEIKTGQLTLLQFDAPSDDGEVHIDYAMELQPTFGESIVTGCLRFNGSPALQKRDPKTFTALTATGANLGPDKLFHIKLSDKFKDMKRLAQFCGGAAGKSDGPGGRPTLTVQPDEPMRAVDAGMPVPSFTPPTPADAGLNGSAAGSGSGVHVPIPGPDMPGSGQAPPDHAGSAAGAAGSAGPGAAGPGTPDIIR